MHDLDVEQGLILTETTEEPITIEGRTIEIKSVVEWLLTDQTL